MPRKKLPKADAIRWRKNWEKSCQEGMKLTKKTPPGFLIDVETIQQILKDRPSTQELWVSFGQETPGGPIKLILQPYVNESDLTHKKAAEDDGDDIYDDFGTCCPKI
ncbi:MAG: hypothetical protein ACK4LB_07680 [Spirosomataceae bacterium]